MKLAILLVLSLCCLFYCLTTVHGTVVEIPLVAVVFAAQQVYIYVYYIDRINIGSEYSISLIFILFTNQAWINMFTEGCAQNIS